MSNTNYEKMRDDLELPPYELIDEEYEIGEIEESTFLLRHIREKISDKLESISDILLGILQPDTNVAHLQEAEYFTEEEKEKLIVIFKTLRYYYRASTRLSVEDDNDSNAKFIKEAHNTFQQLKPDLKKYFDRLRDLWKMESKKKDVVGYFG